MRGERVTYKLNHVVWHSRFGDVVIPDQVVERMWAWDQISMPVPAILQDGRVEMISLKETDA